jgi:hypothetical protein
VTLTSIADALGVGVGTLGEWLRRGQGTSRRPAVEPYLSFAADLEAARERWEKSRAAYLKTLPPRARVRWRRRGEPSPWETIGPPLTRSPADVDPPNSA